MENDKRDLMDNEFRWLATFKGVDPPAGVFVLSLTRAGFCRSSSCGQHQVVCHRCSLLLDLRKLVAQSPCARTHHGILELHRQLSSSCPFVQQFFQTQRLSNVHAESQRDNGAAVSSEQEQTRASSPTSSMVDSDFPVLNGNSRRLRPLGQREERRSVIHPGRASSSSSVNKTRTSSRCSTADDVANNRVPFTSPAQRNSPSNMAGGPFSSRFDRDKPGPHLPAFAVHDSVLGGPGADDLVTDSVQENAEEEDNAPPETQPSDVDFGDHVTLRTGARQQPPQPAPPPGRQEAGAAGGPQHQPVGLASPPGMPAQLSGEREGRNSREPGGGASLASARDLAIETETAKYHGFAIVSDRLRTFRGSTFESPRREELAEAGFFYTGYGDFVQCFHCGTVLKRWEPTDDPWVEHARWRPACSFVRLSKSPEFLSAVRTLSDRKRLDANPGSPPIQLSDVEREMTKLLTAQHQPPAGWDDVPEAMSGEGENDQEMTDDEMQRKLQDLENENRFLQDGRICKICMDRVMSVAFLPCGHFVTCSMCAPVARCCPICRQVVRGTYPVRME